MIDELKLFDLPAGHTLNLPNTGEIFILNTCQRSLVLGFNLVPNRTIGRLPAKTQTFIGQNAYIYLLETICGLNSAVLGENEIVDQFKVAFSQFSLLPNKSSYIQKLIEKLFKDAKAIRSSYLMGLGQLSYAGITRKLLMSKANKGKVLIIGSGQLAKDCIKLLDRKYDLYISSRNKDKINILKSELPSIKLNNIDFKNYNAYQDFSLIINTIGCKDLTLFDHSFFKNWNPASPKLFIDLGSPSVIDTTYNVNDDVYRLSDIFAKSESLNAIKMQKVSEAKIAMERLVEKRKTAYSLNFPYAWEDMQFA